MEREEEEKESSNENQNIENTLRQIASTGTFRHDWAVLKNILSSQLKLVWSEYPEAKMTKEEKQHDDDASSSLQQSSYYSDLLNRLDQALSCFIEGPPFTLQRLCEILLDAKTIYPNLSKLALALEKNLLVTSTLKIGVDTEQQTTGQEPEDHQEKTSDKQQKSTSHENRIVHLVAAKDDMVSKM